MNPADIQCALKKKGVTQQAIAQRVGVSGVAVCDVIHKMRVSDRIMRAVAEMMGEDVRLVFPEYYLRPPKRKNSKVSQSL